MTAGACATAARPSGVNIATLLQRAAEEHPTAPALVDSEGRVVRTVRQLERSAAELAGALARRGCGPGALVLVMVRDPARALPLVLGAIWAGGVAVIPPRTRGIRAMLRLAAAASADVVVADPLSAVACLSTPRLRRRLVTSASLEGARPLAPASVGVTLPALMTWTTGSTGTPAPVVRSHGILVAQHEGVARLRGLGAGDVDLVGLPTMALHDLALAVGFVFAPRRPRWGWDSLGELARRTRATAAAGFPALFERLTNRARPNALSLLRSIQIGGGPVPTSLVERLERAAPHAGISVVYGMTEAEPIASIDAPEYIELATGRAPGDGLPVGTPVDGIQVRIDPFPGRQCGRVLVRGPAVVAMAGRSDPAGWLDTGDAGRMDELGRLWLLGRTAAAVDWFAPAEVEEPVMALPGVAAAALVEMGGAGGPRHVLALEPSASYSSATWRDACALVTRRGWPIECVTVLRRLPRDARSGTKIDLPRLREMVSSAGA
jgi:acyl-CoA synthetase (AMP-forming)/AMP-acid ligase II